MNDGIANVKEPVKGVTDNIDKIRKSLSILGEVIKELWKTFKRPLFITFLSGIVLLVLIPPLTYLYFVRDLKSKATILSRKSAGVILLDRNDKPFFSFYQAKTKTIIPLSRIPTYTQHAVIAVEDKNFYKHPGFSPQSIVRALLTDIRKEELAQGGSTITQQLVKNTLLSQKKSFLRKYQELFLAIEVERRFSKDDILEMYLNTVYFGEGAFGIEDAATVYFNKSASELNVAESALLAAILPAPSTYSPLSGDRKRAFKRQALVINQMRQQGYITEKQAEEAIKQQIVFNPKQENMNEISPHFALMVKQELINKYGEQAVANSGFTVKTTLDLTDQQFAEQAVKRQVAALARQKVTNGAAVALDPRTGEILALVGSHDWFDEKNGKINMAIKERQPGSSFKPIVYARALQRKLITPATPLDDKPVTFPDGYQPKNYDGKFRGQVLARFALANSLNIPAIHVLERVGIVDAISFARELGITTIKNPSEYGLSLVLGSAEVPLLQMTAAFGTFANEGEYIRPTTILEIRDKLGNSIYTYQPTEKRVIDRAVAFLISSILSDNTARSEVFGNALTISRPAAVKTGTTEDWRDAVTIGYTPSLVVGVWVGNNDNTPMDSIAGSLGAAPIWRQIMEHMLRGTRVEQFIPPSDVIRVQVCKENGLRAEAATSSAYTEFFLHGTVPTTSCTTGSPTPSVSQTPTPPPTQQVEENQETNEPTATPTPFVTEELTPTPLPPSIFPVEVTITP